MTDTVVTWLEARAIKIMNENDYLIEKIILVYR